MTGNRSRSSQSHMINQRMRLIRRAFIALGFGTSLVAAGCGQRISHPTMVPKPTIAVKPTALVGVNPATAPNVPVARKTPIPSTPTAAHVPLTLEFRAFLHRICSALAARDANTLIAALPHYQYNSGLYYGTFNGGEGQTGDPSLLQRWLSAAHVRCVEFAPAVAGHAVVITRGWPLDGGWGLIEFDKYNGQWKINDFTFGDRGQVRYALHSTSQEIVPYGPDSV
jgi:hypothetical protein